MKRHPELVIVYRAVNTLKLNPKNPRIHSKKQISQIARSIKKFGFVVPVLIDANGEVFTGHARIMASSQSGMTHVPTIQISHLTPAQVRAYMITDNKLTLNAEWDDKLLGELLLELSSDLDICLEDTGFETGEIDGLIQGLSDQPEPVDDIPQIDGLAVSKIGDLWRLGKNRVLCANALESAAYLHLMEGMKAASIFIDPPYNVKIDGHVCGLGAIKHREFAMACGEMTPQEFINFLIKVCTHLAQNSKDGSLHYICMDWRHVGELLAAALSAYTEFKNLCVWAKDRAGMGSLYRSQHELVFVFKNGKAPHQNNIELGKYGRSRSNIWSYPSAASSSKKSAEGNLLALHPTVKPTALVADAILDCTSRGEIVLDVFLGSGTTLLAAERVGRVCYGMELDPLYVDTAIRRWQAMTGGKARHAVSGKLFDDLSKGGDQDDLSTSMVEGESHV